ncbi:MAG: hypothetical protein Q7S12_02535 [bacterium]|nr:hypothetical protein [bacterium]
MENNQKTESPEAKIFNDQQSEVLQERTKELIEEIVYVKPQMLIFMDRGARPISWMLREAWDQYAAPKQEMPQIRFVNIGREKGEYINFRALPYREDYDSEKLYQEEVKKFWSKFDTEESKKYIDKLKKDIKPVTKKNAFDEGGGIMLVDDYSVSGFSLELARNFFEKNFPNLPKSYQLFLKKQDEKVFSKENWLGTHLPWNTDKSYTLLSEDEDPEKFLATPEKDKALREKGLALRREIEHIFNKAWMN